MINQKKLIATFSLSFLQNCKKPGNGKKPFCVKTLEPIEVQIHSTSQNDRLNFSFLEDINVDCGKVARNGRKTAI